MVVLDSAGCEVDGFVMFIARRRHWLCPDWKNRTVHSACYPKASTSRNQWLTLSLDVPGRA